MKLVEEGNTASATTPGRLPARQGRRQHFFLQNQWPKIDCAKNGGETWVITEGKLIPIWAFARMVWRAAGDRTPSQKKRIIAV
jgi:hypothetical protein